MSKDSEIVSTDKKVTVLGSAGFDIYAVSKFFKPQQEDKQELIVLDHGSQLWLDNAIHEPGGAGLIAAITFARQSIATTLATKLGADLFGKSIHAILEEESIDGSLASESAAHNTDTTLHLTAEGSDQTTFFYTGSFLGLDKSDLATIPKDTDWLHIATLPGQKATVLALLKILKNTNIKYSINPRYVHMAPARLLGKLFSRAEVLIINRDEASLYLGGYFSLQEAAQKLYHSGIAHCVVFDGLNGCVAIKDGTVYESGAYSSTKAFESCGSEEAFAAGYIATYIQTSSLEQALTHASAQACSVMGILGARAGILQRPALREIKITKGQL